MPSPRPLRPSDPQRVGDYRLVGLLGEGGQGAVYLGRSGDGGDVAVKVLRPPAPEESRSLGELVREIQVARQVGAAATASVLEADLDGAVPYVVSEYIDGPSLQERVETEGPLGEPDLRRLAAATARALAAIHRAGVVHRDFKPGNVLLAADGPRVIDFGIARAAGLRASDGAIGTPAYMSPEQIEDDSPGAPSDIFSWAITMVYAATGTPAFGRLSYASAVHRILHTEPDLDGVPSALRALIRRCLAKDPAGRPSAAEIVRHLEPPPDSSRGADDVDPMRHGEAAAPFPHALPTLVPPPRPVATFPSES